ncbi:MAG: hypothetical protein ABSB60_15190 [Terracidiphilus sp.]|jgi:hypothetical protein
MGNDLSGTGEGNNVVETGNGAVFRGSVQHLRADFQSWIDGEGAEGIPNEHEAQQKGSAASQTGLTS